MEDSVFTKIVKGELPSHKIYEDEQTLAFLNIHPIVEGHALVISKQQVQFLWDLDDATYDAVNATAKKVALHLREVMDVPFVSSRVVGTDVPHAHIHLLPFTHNEDLHHDDASEGPVDHDALARLAQKLHL